MKYGRLPAVFPGGLRTLDYYCAGPLPKAPASLAVPTPPSSVNDGTPWGMLGNDQYGDCGVAGLEHGFECAASATKETEAFPSRGGAVSYYMTYTDGQDSGVVLSQYLAYVRQHGYFGHTVDAYAPVAVHDVPTLQTATWLYGFSYTGITVYAGMEQAAQSTPDPCWVWDSSTLTGGVVGGHCIPVVAYDDNYLYALTWGNVVAIAYPTWHQIADEAWGVITGELVARQGDGRGISIDALRADLEGLAT